VHDPYDLARFVAAQDEGGTYGQALGELRHGRKTTHWMWFVFPQIAGLGHSSMSRRYAIRSLDEAKAYLNHPVLGSRLRECAEVLVGLTGLTAQQIFGAVDAQKLQSSMTLFARATPEETIFTEVLDEYFGGQLDQATLERLES
jgi:uncharacterized protein (DUF1810 family)